MKLLSLIHLNTEDIPTIITLVPYVCMMTTTGFHQFNRPKKKKIRQTGFEAKLVGKFDQIGQVDLT